MSSSLKGCFILVPHGQFSQDVPSSIKNWADRRNTKRVSDHSNCAANLERVAISQIPSRRADQRVRQLPSLSPGESRAAIPAASALDFSG